MLQVIENANRETIVPAASLSVSQLFGHCVLVAERIDEQAQKF